MRVEDVKRMQQEQGSKNISWNKDDITREELKEHLAKKSSKKTIQEGIKEYLTEDEIEEDI